MWKLLVPKKLEKTYDRMEAKLPRLITKVINRALAIIFNLLQLFLGASWVDKEVRKRNGHSVKAHISGFWDLFSVEKATIHHPYFLGHDIRLKVEKWRENEIARLINQRENYADPRQRQTIEDAIERTKYAVPPDFLRR